MYISQKALLSGCGNKLLRNEVSEVIISESPKAKDYDFEVADFTIKGDMKFIHIELYCNQCNKYYRIKKAKNNVNNSTLAHHQRYKC